MQFFTKTPAIGGRIKRKIPDFLVKEITKNGQELEIKCFFEEGKKEVKKAGRKKSMEKTTCI